MATKIPRHAWVVVGDGRKVLFLCNDGDSLYPNLVTMAWKERQNPPTREQGTHKPGRFNDGPSVHRSAVGDTDWHELAEERFARELANTLYRAAHNGAYDDLILVAPPKVLGELRKNLHSEVSDKLVAELDKTLTQHPIHEIERHITAS